MQVSASQKDRKISHDSGKLRAAQEDSELRSYAAWINGRLTSADGLGDKLAHVLPLSEDGSDLCEKIKDGVLLWSVHARVDILTQRDNGKCTSIKT